MSKMNLSFKRIEINKSTKVILITTTVAAVLTVFALYGSRALLGQLSYQKRVIDAKSQALADMNDNKAAIESLRNAYIVFEDSDESAIGTPDKNSKIVLDALPSKYDFPALATSLEALLEGYSIESLYGVDEELQYNNEGSDEAGGPALAAPAVTDPSGLGAVASMIEIPFQLVVATDYEGAQKLLNDLDRSIRPIRITSFEATGGQDDMKITINAKTYYQPEKVLEVSKRVVE